MGNPFKYGVVVTGKNFVDRDKEISQLAKKLASGKSVVIYSNRQMGKSSLIAEFVRRHRGEFLFAVIDLYGITERRRFLESVLRETSAAAYRKVERFAADIVELLKGVQVRMVLADGGKVGFELGSRDIPPADITEVLDFPQKVAAKKRKRLVVVFDEFQEIARLDGVNLLKLMRSKFQHQRDVSYVFSGSKRHLLHQMFEEKEGAFYKFARPMELGPIPAEEFARFLVTRFKAAGGSLANETAMMILRATKGHPYYTQQIAHELFDLTKEPSSREEVDRAIMTAVEHQSPAYSHVWESIKSPLHRRYLLAIARDEDSPYGHGFIERHALRSSSHVQRIEKQLEVRGILDDGKVADPLFLLWLRMMPEA